MDAMDGFYVTLNRKWLQHKLIRPYNHALIEQHLADLDAGSGRTYFDLVLQVFADHPAVRLELT